jgi:hypothetical protein
MLLVPRLLLFRTLEDQILASFPSNIWLPWHRCCSSPA